MLANRLEEIMKKEAISNAELSRLTGLSEKTISKVRRRISNPAPNTKSKILRALNENPRKLKSYEEKEIFI